VEAFLRENPYIDGVMIGEGEDTFRELCGYYAHKRKLSDIAGIAFRKNSTGNSTSVNNIGGNKETPQGLQPISALTDKAFYTRVQYQSHNQYSIYSTKNKVRRAFSYKAPQECNAIATAGMITSIIGFVLSVICTIGMMVLFASGMYDRLVNMSMLSYRQLLLHCYTALPFLTFWKQACRQFQVPSDIQKTRK